MKTIDFERILIDAGFKLVRSTKHLIYSNGQKNVAVPKTREINRMLVRRVFKEIGYQAK